MEEELKKFSEETNLVDSKILNVCYHTSFEYIFDYRGIKIALSGIYFRDGDEMKEFSFSIDGSPFFEISTDKDAETYVHGDDFEKFEKEIIKIFGSEFLNASEIIKFFMSYISPLIRTRNTESLHEYYMREISKMKYIEYE